MRIGIGISIPMVRSPLIVWDLPTWFLTYMFLACKLYSDNIKAIYSVPLVLLDFMIQLFECWSGFLKYVTTLIGNDFALDIHMLTCDPDLFILPERESG